MKYLMRSALLALSLLFAFSAGAQLIQDPTTWTYDIKKKSDGEYQLIFKLKLKEGWHIWSLNPGGDGMQLPPAFNFDPNPNITLKNKLTEKGKAITGTMEAVDGEVTYFHDRVDYVQTVKVKANTIVTGNLEYQVCDDKICLPPKKKTFSFSIQDAVPGASLPDTALAAAPPVLNPDSLRLLDTTASLLPADTGKQTALVGPSETTGDADDRGEGDDKPKGLGWLFLASLGGGLLAVLTPCVYSMIPITVSFFTKRSKSREEGIRNAIYYSLSIIIIFTVLGVLISLIFGANALNWLSTNWVANLFFFAIFLVFGISFLGAFEITLPASWTSKTDSRAGMGSFSGIFFMALTLVIVSFSCTGPIVAPLLVLAGKGGVVGPAIGMLGFSIGLALPFALFAIFPGMLNKIASSGGWMNQVKVTLGFIELALALKFLSNADLQRGWRLLDREIFIALWVVIAVFLGLYLLGKLKLSHDDAPPKNVYGQEYVSLFKLFLAIGTFSFAMYLVPGMWGAPLNGMSAFLPPMGTQDFIAGGGGAHVAPAHASGPKPVKYVDIFAKYEPPVVRSHGLVTYFDYQEALAASKELNKPVFLDFTGINCANCRKMEAQVWSHPEVISRIKNDFVVASLYCDYDALDLPKEQQYFSKALNARVVTVGDLNEDIQASKFETSGQPYYFFVDGDGHKLIQQGYGYDPDVQKFIRLLDDAKAQYQNKGTVTHK